MTLDGMDVEPAYFRCHPPLPSASVGDDVFAVRGGKAGVFKRPVHQPVNERRGAGILREEPVLKPNGLVMGLPARLRVDQIIAVDVGGIVIDEDLTVDEVQLAVISHQAGEACPGARTGQLDQRLSQAGPHAELAKNEECGEQISQR